MRWPWRNRERDAEKQADEAEAGLLMARLDYLKAHDLAGQARHEAEKSRRAHVENGFAQLIRTAMGVSGGKHRP